MIITIMLTSASSSNMVVSAQQSNMAQETAINLSGNNKSQIEDEILSNDSSTQGSLFDDNQSVNIAEPTEQRLDNGEPGPAGPQGPAGVNGTNGEPGPAGPSGNDAMISMNIIYVKNGTQESTSDDSFVTTSATCNENDIPISGGYSVVSEDEDENNAEINEIESIPNIQNNSWTISLEGENIEVTPYVVCITITQ